MNVSHIGIGSVQYNNAGAHVLVTGGTNSTSMNRFGEASEVANAALFLTSGATTYITGQTLNVYGGYSVAS